MYSIFVSVVFCLSAQHVVPRRVVSRDRVKCGIVSRAAWCYMSEFKVPELPIFSIATL